MDWAQLKHIKEGVDKYLYTLDDNKVRKLKTSMYEEHFNTNFRLKRYVKEDMPSAINRELTFDQRIEDAKSTIPEEILPKRVIK